MDGVAPRDENDLPIDIAQKIREMELKKGVIAEVKITAEEAERIKTQLEVILMDAYLDENEAKLLTKCNAILGGKRA